MDYKQIILDSKGRYCFQHVDGTWHTHIFIDKQVNNSFVREAKYVLIDPPVTIRSFG